MWITQRALYIVPTALFVALVAIADMGAQQRTINDFFNDFTAEWIRTSPNLAVADRYFTGAEQDRLEQQLTPDTPEYRRSRVLLAKQGLDGLKKFNATRYSAVSFANPTPNAPCGANPAPCAVASSAPCPPATA